MIKEIIKSIYPISGNGMTAIEKLAEYERFSKGEVFIKKNRRNEKEYFVLEGICKSFVTNPEGQEITISFFLENMILSPSSIRNVKGVSNISFQAMTDIRLASLDAAKFEELIRNHIDIRNFANTVLQNELITKVEKEIGLASMAAKERLIIFRQKYPLLENLIPHTDIATYLGITTVSLSRLRKELAP